MTAYIATFFTHYDAVVFAQKLSAQNISAHCCPVPRELSSSCGTAVRFSLDNDLEEWVLPFVEQIFCLKDAKWHIIFNNT